MLKPVLITLALSLTACTHHIVQPTIHPLPNDNFSSRISTIVLHYTAENDERSIYLLTKGQVSSHYLITEQDSRIYQLVPDDKMAWHAGESHWRGRTHLNDTAIGIEIVNQGVKDEYRQHKGYRPPHHYVAYTDEQIEQLAQLLRLLIDKYDIDPRNIVAHADIAPSRKTDPGAKFPWRLLHEKYHIGAWYDETDKAAFMTDSTDGIPIKDIKAKLRDYGYNINDTDEWDRASRDVVYAFQLHFNPTNATGEMDTETYAILQALHKKYVQR